MCSRPQTGVTGRRDARLVPDDDPCWLRFWAMYPRHEAKLDARKAWMQLAPSPELVEMMIEALTWQIPLHQWNGEKRDFVPLPASWLRGARWEDEAPVSSAPSPSWLDQCRELKHDPACQSSTAHELRKQIAAKGCTHPGVCQSFGQHQQRVAGEQKAVAS